MPVFDTATNGGFVVSTSLTWSHTCTGSDLFLVVGVMSNANALTGVTYNGVAASQLGAAVLDGNGIYYASFWSLNGPASGAHNVVVSSSSSQDLYGLSGSWTDVNATGFPDASNTNSTTGSAAVTYTLTTVADNAWMVGVVMSLASAAPTAGTGTILRVRNLTYGGLAIIDSNGALTPPGSHSIQADPGGTGWMECLFASVAPVTVVSTTNKAYRGRITSRPAPFRPMGDAFRTNKYGGWR